VPCCAVLCCPGTEVEREKECVCIVSHQAVLRALYGYFMDVSLEVGGRGGWRVGQGLLG